MKYNAKLCGNARRVTRVTEHALNEKFEISFIETLLTYLVFYQ